MNTSSNVFIANRICDFELTDPYTLPSLLADQKDRLWQDLVSRHPDTFDGELLGLETFKVIKNRILFRCRKTSYSSYICTRDPEFKTQHPKLERADPIGVTVIAISKDERVIVSKRSEKAEQCPGEIYFVGGYASCNKQGLQSTGTDLKPVESINLIEDGIRELKEETGVVEIEPHSGVLLGLAYDALYCHPEVTVLLKLTKSYDELYANFSSARDKSESEKLYGIPLSDIISRNLPKELRKSDLSWSFETSSSFLSQWLGK